MCQQLGNAGKTESRGADPLTRIVFRRPNGQPIFLEV